MKKIGLTLGKFAPLHKGHQYMIETALKEMDELFVMVYAASVTDIQVNVRAEWIRKLYPSVYVLECWDGPDGVSYEESWKRLQEEYILRVLNGQKITHFYSSEPYGDHVSKALGAVDRRVDDARKVMPISATMIRENPWKHRKFIDDVVYQDLVTKVVFLGAESTGKSTIVKELAKRYNTKFVSEYGRDYWFERQIDGKLTLDDMDEIAKGHLEREKVETLKANKYLFVDTNAITTYMFSKMYHGTASKFLENLAEKNASMYDVFFLCDTDIPFEDTWDRCGKEHQLVFQKDIIADLERQQIPYTILRGSLEERMANVDEVLKGLKSKV